MMADKSKVAERPHVQPVYTLTEDDLSEISEMKAGIDRLEQEAVENLGPPPGNVEELYTDIVLPGGWSSKTLVVRPRNLGNENSPKPLIIYFFGGGFMFGSPGLNIVPARGLAAAHGAVVICPTYRCVPQVRWPTPMYDAWNLVSHFASHSADSEMLYGANLDDGFIVAGFSAGAQLAAVIAGIDVYGQLPGINLNTNGAEHDQHLHQIQPLAKSITGVFLSIPLLLHEDIVPEPYKFNHFWTSREENANRDFPKEHIDKIYKFLDCTDYQSLWFSPIPTMSKLTMSPSTSNEKETRRIPSQSELPIHPPVSVVVGQFDPLRDDGLVYIDLLSKMGTPTKSQVMREDGHASWTTLPMPIPKNKDPTQQEAVLQGIAWLLHAEK